MDVKEALTDMLNLIREVYDEVISLKRRVEELEKENEGLKIVIETERGFVQNNFIKGNQQPAHGGIYGPRISIKPGKSGTPLTE
jgi:regulator of replication initiation timing